MAILKPDKTTIINGVTVNEFLLTKHNPNKIAMPTETMNYAGVTIHNTDDLENVHDDAEQYTRATYNGNMKDTRVHYYVDDVCAWQNLPLTLQGWHAADNKGKGNTTTVAIECIMKGSSGTENVKAEDNCAKLAAWLLYKKGLGIDKLYTHTHWLNVRDKKTGSVDYLNTTKNSYKNCPLYILPHWTTFKAKVKSYLDKLNTPATTAKPTTTTKTLYRVRKSWTDAKSQLGAFSNLTNAKALVDKNKGYKVFDNKGKVVYEKTSSSVTQTTTKPKPTATTSNVKYFPKYNGSTVSIVSALNSLKITSTYSYRTKIAKANKINLYVGTASQNTKMLNLLKQGKLIKP